MVVIFGSMLLRGGREAPEWSRPLAGIGAMTFVLFSVVHIMANQFGFDRDGFRVFVLSAAPRRDILLGKNLAFAPLALGVGLILLVIVQIARPMRLDLLLAMVPQYLSMYLMFCILTNMLSIYAPVHVPAGSLRPANPSVSTVLLQLLTILVLFPMTQALTLLPLGTELIMQMIGEDSRVPICLLLTLLECAVIAAVYHVCLRWQGGLLQDREQRILDSVTNRSA
jgi:hypothetical protein